MAAKPDLELEKRGKITTNYTVYIYIYMRAFQEYQHR